ncbi:MAG: DUF503 domain-containing protein [Deltaproteobacteria bacterium]|nr:DUF503 domain-containing protein [Deltaproteobacteria bacterium]
MVVGAARVSLQVHGSQSLKAKRGVLRSIARRLQNRFNLSVAEVGGQGTWQSAEIGLATVANEAVTARRRLEKAIAFVEDLHLAEVLGQEVEIW